MAKHFLYLNIPPVTNEGIFLVDDISIYDPAVPFSCPNLQITPPGFNTPSVFEGMAKHYRLILNACMLGIAPPNNCLTSCPNLPDGIYHLRYSVSPNDLVFVEYDYLRIVAAINLLNNMLCKLNLQCCLPGQETVQLLQDIDIIRDFLISAQTNVNDLHQYEDGINQYRYAMSLLHKMSTCRPFCSV